MKTNDVIALILAGGKGERLDTLTRFTAKPAIPFGGKYRIIDFALSNCINSGISDVGVLTQYEPLELSEYIGNGSTWGMDRLRGGISLLPPYVKKHTGSWYKGTANAVYQNINYVENSPPKYLLILSGDHIYKMNYRKMLAFHIAHNSDCTVATVNVTVDDAKRFGIVVSDGFDKIIDFEEKPKNPKSTKASMSVYIFNWQILKKYLIIDSSLEASTGDFGKDVLPAMLKDGCNMYAYPFFGYWRDVGTPESLWRANMDLLCDNLLTRNSEWKIFSNSPSLPPALIEKDASIKNSIISGGCEIRGKIENSVIFGKVKISKNSYVKNSVIFSNSVISEGCEIINCLLNENTTVYKNCRIGEPGFITALKRNSKIRLTEKEKNVVS